MRLRELRCWVIAADDSDIWFPMFRRKYNLVVCKGTMYVMSRLPSGKFICDAFIRGVKKGM